MKRHWILHPLDLLVGRQRRLGEKAKFVYHYLAEFQCSGGTTRIDGIIESDKKITNYDGYTAMKRKIARNTEVEYTPEKIAICTLNLIHKL